MPWKLGKTSLAFGLEFWFSFIGESPVFIDGWRRNHHLRRFPFQISTRTGTGPIGIVSSYSKLGSYFEWHGDSEDSGLQVGGTIFMGALVEEGLPVILAHEIGHSFGLYPGLGIPTPVPIPFFNHDPSTDPVEGYWSQFPGGHLSVPSFMIGDDHLSPAKANDPNNFWIDSTDYLNLFGRLTSPSKEMRKISSSNLVYFGGFLSQNSGFALDSFVKIGSNSINVPTTGAGVARFLDPNGNQIAVAYFDPTFAVEKLTPNGPTSVPTDTVPISLVAEFDPKTAAVEVSVNNNLVGMIDPNASLLSTAISNIPARGFVGDATAGREALLQIALDFQGLMAAQSYQAAESRLQNVLLPAVTSNVSGNIIVQNPIEVTQVELIGIINNLIQQIQTSLLPLAPNPKNPIFQLLTDRSSYPSGEAIHARVSTSASPISDSTEYFATIAVDNIQQPFKAYGKNAWLASVLPGTAGVHKLKANLFLQPKVEAHRIQASIDRLSLRAKETIQEIENSTDVAVIQRLRNELVDTNHEIAVLQARQSSIRTEIGGAVETSVISN